MYYIEQGRYFLLPAQFFFYLRLVFVANEMTYG